jgi:hypothetical protein
MNVNMEWVLWAILVDFAHFAFHLSLYFFYLSFFLFLLFGPMPAPTRQASTDAAHTNKLRMEGLHPIVQPRRQL